MSEKKMSIAEKSKRVRLEKEIREDLFSAGEKFKTIRDEGLYREDFDTFEEYCKEVWGFSRQQGYRLIESWEVVSELPENVTKLVTNEGQARALSKIPPPRRAEVLKDIKDSGEKVTAKSISVRVPPPPTKKEPYVPPDKLDEIGRKIPDALHALWERAHEVDEIVSLIQSAKNRLAKADKENDPLLVHFSFHRSIGPLEATLAELKGARPYSLCAKCHGKLPEDCADCKGTGFIGEFFWKTSVPEETKKIILKTIKK